MCAHNRVEALCALSNVKRRKYMRWEEHKSFPPTCDDRASERGKECNKNFASLTIFIKTFNIMHKCCCSSSSASCLPSHTWGIRAIQRNERKNNRTNDVESQNGCSDVTSRVFLHSIEIVYESFRIAHKIKQLDTRDDNSNSSNCSKATKVANIFIFILPAFSFPLHIHFHLTHQTLNQGIPFNFPPTSLSHLAYTLISDSIPPSIYTLWCSQRKKR